MGEAIGISLLISGLCTALAIPVLRQWAIHWGWLDWPDSRKRHAHPTPVVGGIAMFGGWTSAMVWLHIGDPHFHMPWALLIPAAALWIAGIWDDKHRLSPRVRLMIQIGAAGLAVWLGDLRVIHLGNLWGTGIMYLDGWSVPFTIFAIVGVTNAINLLDGLDGLAAGVMAIVATGFYGLAVAQQMETEQLLLLNMAITLVVFLAWNLRIAGRAARIFMGDAGTLMWGFVMAWCAIRLTQPLPGMPVDPQQASPVIVLLMLGIPIADTVVVLGRRLYTGRPPFLPAPDHAHYLCMQRWGWSVEKTTLMFWGGTVILVGLGGVGGWLYRWPDWILMGFFGIVVAGCLGLSQAMPVRSR